MRTLITPTGRYTLAPTRDVGAFAAQLAKCTGKTKPAKMRARDSDALGPFPEFKPGMSTAEYVARYCGNRDGFFAALNTEPCALYEDEDEYEDAPLGVPRMLADGRRLLITECGRYVLAPGRDIAKFQRELERCSKPRKPRIAPERRDYPAYGGGMSTADYVAAYEALNHGLITDGFFAPLNTEPCALYDGADLFETIDEQAQEQAAAPIAPEPCTHTPSRLYSGFAMQGDGVTRQWVACCDCGAALTPCADIAPPVRDDTEQRAQDLAARLIGDIGAACHRLGRWDAAPRMAESEAARVDRAAQGLPDGIARTYRRAAAMLREHASDERARRGDAKTPPERVPMVARAQRVRAYPSGPRARPQSWRSIVGGHVGALAHRRGHGAATMPTLHAPATVENGARAPPSTVEILAPRYRGKILATPAAVEIRRQNRTHHAGVNRHSQESTS